MKGKLIQNKYSILQVLGQDVFSETFLARDKNRFSRHRYVIKKFRPVLGNPRAEATRHLFYQEASILKRLSGKNPQIPQLCEYFIDGEDFYIVREWIEGLTLKQKVQQQGKLAPAEVERILDSILSFLKYIHGYGIVYRQLKPSSIILRRGHWLNPTQKELPIPIYFGGVKELETESINHRSLVLAHQQEYISPEQGQGKSVYASDLYSLGLTAIYLLTGKTPAQLPLNPQTKKLLWHQEVPQLQINLVRVIDRAICPRISDRFSSATQMLDSLHSPTVSMPDTLNRGTRRQLLTPEAKIVSCLFLLSIGVTGITFLWLNPDLVQWFKNGFDRQTDRTPNDALVQNNSSNEQNEGQLPVNLEENELLSIDRGGDRVATEIPTYVSPCYSQESCSAIEVLFVPAFTLGTPLEQITDSLGEPDRQSKGYWQNSSAVLYEFIPDQIDLGYLSDVETDVVRQSEISFAETVDLLTIQQAAQRLLGDNYSADIEHNLNQIYLNNSDRYQFEFGNIEGVVERNSTNHIYFSIWDSTFHQLSVEPGQT